MLHVGVIGAGAIAQEAYLPAIKALTSTQLRSVVDIDEDRARTISNRFNAEGYATHPESITDEVDVAVIATPPRYHADIAETFLTEGIPVFTEKPVATSSERGKELLDISERTGTHFGISRQLRESPAIRVMRDFYRVGSIGYPQAVDMRFGDQTEWEFASDYRLRKNLAWGGVLTDKAPHALDALRWIFGKDVTVRSYRDDSLGGLEANAEIDLRFGDTDPFPVTLEVTSDRDISNELVIRGDAGVLRGDPNGSRAVFKNGVDEEVLLQPSTDGALGRFRPRVAKQLERFIEAVSGESANYVPAADGVRLVSLLESCYAQRRPLTHPWEQVPQPLKIWS